MILFPLQLVYACLIYIPRYLDVLRYNNTYVVQYDFHYYTFVVFQYCFLNINCLRQCGTLNGVGTYIISGSELLISSIRGYRHHCAQIKKNPNSCLSIREHRPIYPLGPLANRRYGKYVDSQLAICVQGKKNRFLYHISSRRYDLKDKNICASI